MEITEFEMHVSNVLSYSGIEEEIMMGFDAIQDRHVNRQSKDRFSVWDIGYECIRKKYYSIVDPREVSWSLRKRFAVGSGIHHQIQVGLEEYGYNIEVPIVKHYDDFGFDVSTKIDALYGDVDNPIKLVEIKSAAFFKFIRSPYKSNVAQLQQYMDVLGMDVGYLLYIDTETGNMKEFAVERDDDIIFNNLMKLEVIRDCIINEALPPKKKKQNICKMCQYNTECSNNDIIV